MSHVFVRPSGHGLVLLPFWPYRFSREGNDPSSVRVSHWSDGQVHQAVIDRHHRSCAAGIVDVADGSHDGDWLIETTRYACQWPPGFTIDSTSDPSDHVKFSPHRPRPPTPTRREPPHG